MRSSILPKDVHCIFSNHSVELKEYPRNGWCRNWCRASIICTPKEFVNMCRCFWEERLSRISICKNDKLLTHN
jgi:hypothetical protein